MTSYHRQENSRSAVWRRILIYSAVFFFIGIIQCSFFGELKFLKAVPNIILGTIAAVSLCDSQKCAIICSIAAGFYIDALGSSGFSLSPLAFLIIAIICTEIGKKMLPTFLSFVLILLPATVLNGLLTVINILLTFGKFNFLQIFKSVLLPEFILTFLFSLPIFYIIKPCVKFANAKSKYRI